MRDRLPSDWIAASCSPITQAAPMTAAITCATSRVRLGPSVMNSAMVIATANAMAVKLIAITTA